MVSPWLNTEAQINAQGPFDITNLGLGKPVTGYNLPGATLSTSPQTDWLGNYSPWSGLEQAAQPWLQGIYPGGSNPEGIGTAFDPSKNSFLNSGNVIADPGIGKLTDVVTKLFSADTLYRGVLIVLGVIFIAVGLSMFGYRTIEQVKHAVS
jgi:hypothetical protein